MNSFSGVYPYSQISPAARAPSRRGLYSNTTICCFPRDYAGYNQTCRVIPTDVPDSRSNIIENDMVFHCAFPDPYRSGMNEPLPSSIAKAGAMYSDYRTRRRPLIMTTELFNLICMLPPELHMVVNLILQLPPVTITSLVHSSLYWTMNPRPPYGSFTRKHATF
ncbi:hypothetical protein Lalb_Chr20g0122291 [Lupinus albus]|uniref:Uncharacterized protein n=1 Tax=Lupinus albus TaxID=3870 RepID=A0A6A4NDM8_LUPAL|nr:hypothetical protein Lalb_Chr20g0122291 [Lupinus albus]